MSGESTASMWANMLGLGPLLGAINDPSFQDQIKAIVFAINDTGARVARIEEKLDQILAREPSYGRRKLASIPFDNGMFGDGTDTATGGVANHGTGDAPAKAFGA
jgi:hypothetical protein